MSASVLAGRRIVVTRAVQQGQPLVDEIHSHGGVAVVLPLIEIQDAEDGGEGLRRCLEALTEIDWLVVLSPNGAVRVVDLVDPAICRLAVIASGTAAVFEDAGWTVDLIPEITSSEGLLAAFRRTQVRGRVVIAQAAGGRRVLADGLAADGIDVESVVAYRNLVASIDTAAAEAAREADTVVFASPSAVRRYVDAVGLVPKRSVCIGTVTAAEAKEAGFEVTVSSEPTTASLLVALGQYR